jgi:hypothetical protein
MQAEPLRFSFKTTIAPSLNGDASLSSAAVGTKSFALTAGIR